MLAAPRGGTGKQRSTYKRAMLPNDSAGTRQICKQPCVDHYVPALGNGRHVSRHARLPGSGAGARRLSNRTFVL